MGTFIALSFSSTEAQILLLEGLTYEGGTFTALACAASVCQELTDTEQRLLLSSQVSNLASLKRISSGVRSRGMKGRMMRPTDRMV